MAKTQILIRYELRDDIEPGIVKATAEYEGKDDFVYFGEDHGFGIERAIALAMRQLAERMLTKHPSTR